MQPAGGDRLHRDRGSAASTDRAMARLQRSGERCAQRIRIAHPCRPLLYRGPAKGAPDTLTQGPCLITKLFVLPLQGWILPGSASGLPEPNFQSMSPTGVGFARVFRSQALSDRDPAELGPMAAPAALGRVPTLQGKATSSLRQASLSSAVRGPSVRNPISRRAPWPVALDLGLLGHP